MKCLNEYQLEMINDGVGQKACDEHLSECSICLAKMGELRANLSIQDEISDVLKKSREG